MLRRKWYLLVLGLAAGLGGGYYHFTKQEPVYRSTAEVTVSYREASLPVENDLNGRPQSPQNVLGDYLHRIQTPPLIQRAVEEHDLADLPRFRGGGSPVGTILGGLSGRQIEGTRVLQLGYVGKSPEETKAVLDAVVATFIDSVKEDEQSVSQEAVELITKANDQVRGELESAEAAYREFQRTSPLTRGEDGSPVNPYAADLLQIDAHEDELRLQLTTLTAEIDAIRKALAEGGRREALAQMAAISRQNESDGESSPAATQLSFEEKHLDLLLELEEARERFGENYPERKRLENRYAAVRKLMAERAGLTGSEESAKSFLDLFVDARQEKAEVLKAQIAMLNEEYASTEKEAEALRDAELTERELRDQLARHAAMHTALVDKISQLDLTKDAERVRVASLVPATLGALTPVELIRSLSMGGVMGLAVAFGLAYLLEQGDRSFKGPEELRAEFGLPLLGHVPVIPAKTLRRTKQTGKLDPSLLTIHRPQSRLAESFHAVRAGLAFAARSGVKVIQVTSGDPGDGKSTLAANLAVSLGRSGKSTVLVDVDLRRPRVAGLFGLPKEGVSVTDVIENPDKLSDAVVESGVPGLSLLPCLRKADHPAELLSSQAFEDFVEVLRHKFDFVVLDSPPVLAVSDPAAIAPSADGVVLVTRLSKRTRRKVQESLDTLDRAGANLLGLVVNAVDSSGEYVREVESGYYGGYGYGYGRTKGSYYSNEKAAPPVLEEPASVSGKAPVNGH
ncbi:polysaccharide biosynthesis tyrosine autokinase [Alienimonas chondri]|uniref:polysaccharide biosynthesis tyrosine autokinase n=1 Tax=Alienimonas chondri TaxID=2681879 RepID=UPI00148A08B1|nr:tyrosine-protein kinase domain-containing protein [Alienimonas chondri]